MKKATRAISAMLLLCFLLNAIPAQAADKSKIQVAASISSSAVIDENGNLWTWGENRYGQSGQGTAEKQLQPKQIMKDIAAVSLGSDNMMVLDKQGRLWGCGSNLDGVLMEKITAGATSSGIIDGNGIIISGSVRPESAMLTTPTQLMSGVSQVSAGTGHVLALKKDGTVWAWGTNASGQLGNGAAGDLVTKPVQVLSDATSVYMAWGVSFAIKQDGSLWFWGKDKYSLDQKVSYTPQKVMDNVKQIALGGLRMLALKTDGTVWSWGKRSDDEPGYDKKAPFATPEKLLENAVSVYANEYAFGAITNEADLYMWGSNARGMVGTGEATSFYPNPVKITDRAAQLAIGYDHVLAVKEDGSVYAWGKNVYGTFPFVKDKLIAQPSLLLYQEAKMELSRTVTPAANKDTPAPPAWVKPEEYQVFKDDILYTSSDWDTVLRFRDEVHRTGKTSLEMQDFYDSATKASANDPAVYFEMGLIFEEEVRRGDLAKMNTGVRMVQAFSSCVRKEIAKSGSASYLSSMWLERGTFLRYIKPHDFQYFAKNGLTGKDDASYIALMQYPEFNKNNYFDHAFFDAAKKTTEWPLFANQIAILVENHLVKGDAPAEIQNQRTMVPLRLVAENLLAQVSWDGAANTVTITRAGDTIKVIPGSTTAYKNGTPIVLDAAPYTKNSRTYVPLRFVSEQLGQKIAWYPGGVVSIYEDPALYESTNVDEWMRAMNSGYVGNNMAAMGLDFGVFDRWTIKSFDAQRASLAANWGVSSRSDLLALIKEFTEGGGHNGQYLAEVADVASMSDAQRKQITATVSDGYMFAQLEAWNKKWGEKGVIAWDLCRISMLAQWGYQDGYLTAAEAIALATPAVEKFKATFTSWDEGIGNYLDGYAWWSRTDTAQLKSTYVTRTNGYAYMKKSHPELLDDAMFSKPLVPLTSITYKSIYNT